MRPNLDQLAQLSQRLQEQEAQLRQKRQDLLALINASPEAIFLMRPDGAVILANEALARRVRPPRRAASRPRHLQLSATVHRS